mgnify:CR=1 FL=1|tara:strand:+ start:901 stop:2184 length:1284 start_codon:yes stop_codon:yes gene_type:complete
MEQPAAKRQRTDAIKERLAVYQDRAGASVDKSVGLEAQAAHAQASIDDAKYFHSTQEHLSLERTNLVESIAKLTAQLKAAQAEAEDVNGLAADVGNVLSNEPYHQQALLTLTTEIARRALANAAEARAAAAKAQAEADAQELHLNAVQFVQKLTGGNDGTTVLDEKMLAVLKYIVDGQPSGTCADADVSSESWEALVASAAKFLGGQAAFAQCFVGDLGILRTTSFNDAGSELKSRGNNILGTVMQQFALHYTNAGASSSEHLQHFEGNMRVFQNAVVDLLALVRNSDDKLLASLDGSNQWVVRTVSLVIHAYLQMVCSPLTAGDRCSQKTPKENQLPVFQQKAFTFKKHSAMVQTPDAVWKHFVNVLPGLFLADGASSPLPGTIVGADGLVRGWISAAPPKDLQVWVHSDAGGVQQFKVAELSIVV